MDDYNQEIVQTNADKSSLMTPLSFRGIPPWAIYVFTAIGMVYLLNPTAGFIELLPDNLPIIGNIDEGVAALMIWYGLVEYFEGRKLKNLPPPPPR